MYDIYFQETLELLIENNKDPGFKQYYKKYCKTLRLLITASKKKKH